MREAQFLQGAVDRVVRYREPELLVQSHDQIARPPAHYAMDGRDRALVHDPGKESLVLVPELGGPPGEGMLMRPSGPRSLNRITQSRNV
jgi:hypothetical protein